MSRDAVLTALLDRLERELHDWEQGGAARAVLGDVQRWVALQAGEYIPGLGQFRLDDVLQAIGEACGIGYQIQGDLQLRRWGDAEAVQSLLRTFVWSFAPARIGCLQAEQGRDAHCVRFSVVAETLPAPHPSPYLQSLAAALKASWEGPQLTMPLAQTEADADPPVDIEFFLESTFNDPGFQRELSEAFREEGTRQLLSLRDNYTRDTLHSLRGSAALIGAKRLARMLETEEKALNPAALEALETEFGRVLGWLDQQEKPGGISP